MGLDGCTRERLEKDRERLKAATDAASAGQYPSLPSLCVTCVIDHSKGVSYYPIQMPDD